MDTSRNEEIDLTLDDDSQSNHCEDKLDDDIIVDKEDENQIEMEESTIKESKSNKNNSDIINHSDAIEIDIENDNNQKDEINLINEYPYQEQISKLIKYEIKLQNGQFVHIYSCGPIQQHDNKIFRPINCHACRFTTIYFDQIKSHTISEEHKFNVLHFSPEKKYTSIYNIYDSNPKDFKIMLCIFSGEDIPEVYEENRSRLVYFCKTTDKIKLQKIVLNMTKKDNLAEVNKTNPVLGLQYCIKFSNNNSYFCVLCNEHLSEDPSIHFNKKSHINNFIVRHLLIAKNKIAALLKNILNGVENKNELIDEIILEIYRNSEKKNKFQKIYIIDQKMFNCFRSHFVKIVCNYHHFCDDHITQNKIKLSTKQYIEKCKEFKSGLLNDDDNGELVIINDENEYENSENINKEVCEILTEDTSNEENCLEDCTIVSDHIDIENNDDQNLNDPIEFEFDEANLNIINAEKEFEKLKHISDLVISKDPITNEEASNYWLKSTFSLEYVIRCKYYENGREFLKFKCTLCNKFLTNLIVSHTSCKRHRKKYIDEHFPILKSYLIGSLSQMNLSDDKLDIIIGQMIAEICQRLKKRTSRYLNWFYRANFKKNPKNKQIDDFLRKCCLNKNHYDDQFFVSVYKEKTERTMFLKDLLRRFVNTYNNEINYKRKNIDIVEEDNEKSKRIKVTESDNVPITLISVLKLIEKSPDLEEVRVEAKRLLMHAEEMEQVNGNITELMKSIEYLNFFKKIIEILKIEVESGNTAIAEDKMKSINKILDNSSLLVESMEEGIVSNEPTISEVLTIDDDDEPEFISSTTGNDNLKKLPNPFSSKFKKPTPTSNGTKKTNQQHNYSSNFSANRNFVNNEIRVNNRNAGQSYMSINRPNSSILTLNTNVNRFNNNPVLNVTTYRETTQMNMSIPILGNSINNQNQFRNVFVNNQQNNAHRFQNPNIPQQHINFSKAFTSYASRATSLQQSTLSGASSAVTQQSVRARILPPRTIPIVLSNTSAQTSAAVASATQNSIFNARLNFRAPIRQAPPVSTFQHVSISSNNLINSNANFNNIHGNALPFNQRFQTIRAPFSLNNTFPGAYGNTRNMFAGRTNF